MRKKNIYMGNNSVANIPAHGKINDDLEILMNIYATSYDSINDVMLTRTPGVFDRATIQEIRGRFFVLKNLVRKYCPQKMKICEEMERIAIDNVNGKISDAEALRVMRQTLHREKPNNLIYEVERKIDQAEALQMGRNPGILDLLNGNAPGLINPPGRRNGKPSLKTSPITKDIPGFVPPGEFLRKMLWGDIPPNRRGRK